MHASVILFVLALNTPQSAPQARDAKAIEKAKHTNVHQIEPSLPNRAFAQWMRDLAGTQAEIKWGVNDCGEQTGNPALDKRRDLPMCVEAQVTPAGKRKFSVGLSVGTLHTGVKTGPAGFAYAVIIEPDGSLKWVKSLSRLREELRAVK
ncbi:MAG: hypothetical protein ABSD27_13680 [Bryobacteraceae bacterium]|jgi:hypothetical protein